MILVDFPVFGPNLPILGKQCFGTDDRSFSHDPEASARVTADFIVWISNSPKVVTEPSKRFKSGPTRKIDCATGRVLATKSASVSNCHIGAPAFAGGTVQVVVGCRASDPLLPFVPEKFTPDLHFSGSFTYKNATRIISFRGDVGAFPSYEAYASLNGGPFKLIFATAPEKGAGGPSLIDLWQHINVKKIDTGDISL
jgi:hypothetical protein